MSSKLCPRCKSPYRDHAADGSCVNAYYETVAQWEKTAVKTAVNELKKTARAIIASLPDPRQTALPLAPEPVEGGTDNVKVSMLAKKPTDRENSK